MEKPQFIHWDPQARVFRPAKVALPEKYQEGMWERNLEILNERLNSGATMQEVYDLENNVVLGTESIYPDRISNVGSIAFAPLSTDLFKKLYPYRAINGMSNVGPYEAVPIVLKKAEDKSNKKNVDYFSVDWEIKSEGTGTRIVIYPTASFYVKNPRRNEGENVLSFRRPKEHCSPRIPEFTGVY